MTDPVLAGLSKRRAELLAEAKAADATLRRLLDDIAHVDGAIRIYDPTYRPHKVRLSRAARVGTSRIMLAILRAAKAPMTLRDITLRIMTEEGRDRDDSKLVREMMERVRIALLRQRRAGAVQSAGEPGQLAVWGIVR